MIIALKPLWRPVYLPSLVYAAGASILGPVSVVLALQLGISASGVVALVTWLGAFSILASFVSGYAVAWLGEGRAVTIGSCAAALALGWAAVAAWLWRDAAFWWLVLALMVCDLVDAVWSIARQSIVSDLAPPQHRGLAVNLYGACQRLGRMLGPLIVALLLLFSSPQAALPVVAAILLIAMALLLRARPARTTGPGGRPETGDVEAGPSLLRPLLLLGLGILVLAGMRTVKETLIPLWASDVVQLTPSAVALVAAVMSATELVLFLPAGLALDRLGRTPVVVTALLLMGIGLAILPLNTSQTWLVLCACMLGLGDGAGAGIIKTLGVDLAPRHGRAQFLGHWQTIASVGACAAPAAVTAVTTMAGLGLGIGTLGIVGMFGALWMAWWTPRFISHRGRKGL